MKSLFEDKCIPLIRSKFKMPIIYQKTIKTTGIGESWLSDLILDWENNLENDIKLAYLPSLGRVKLRLTAKGYNKNILKKIVNDQIKKLIPKIEEYVFGFDNDELENVIGKLLTKRKKPFQLRKVVLVEISQK